LIRPVILLAIGLAPWAGAATAGPGSRVEMDVLELHELPTQAVQRMEEAQQRAAARRRGPDEHPRAGAFLPEDSLGDRGLAAPAVELIEADLDGEHGRDKDHGDKDDKRPGGG